MDDDAAILAALVGKLGLLRFSGCLDAGRCLGQPERGWTTWGAGACPCSW